MKKSAKILSGVCAMALAVCMGTTAFAADITSTDDHGNKETGDVKISAEVSEPADSISVNVAWEDMTFSYGGGTAPSDWNPATHAYNDEGTAPSWNKNSAKVTVTNHSNVAVGLAGSYTSSDYPTGEANANGVTVTYTNFTVEQLAVATPDTLANPGLTQAEATVAVSGAPDVNIPEVTAGTITVTISAAGE